MKILIPLLIITNLITAFFAFDLNRNSLEIEQKLDEARAIETQLMRAYESRLLDIELMEEKLLKKEAELKTYLSEEVDRESSNRE
ncbi:hypothetical protein N9292_01145 [Akkermansiaceae bacterium]|jgi:hypothetical protein|nr:hypothetical protein [Akkermansiaceae bacterium]MDB4669397.1 hypothetical protein [bacterium]MDA8973423.1 hypothetical protein [Akkermansiaceae bacterium]MDB4424024.1 hypothetical protein [Akkermansiaceae bacterium]MDB4431960.1 hypothetical protein [Akkermansiaceae bacterium]